MRVCCHRLLWSCFSHDLNVEHVRCTVRYLRLFLYLRPVFREAHSGQLSPNRLGRTSVRKSRHQLCYSKTSALRTVFVLHNSYSTVHKHLTCSCAFTTRSSSLKDDFCAKLTVLFTALPLFTSVPTWCVSGGMPRRLCSATGLSWPERSGSWRGPGATRYYVYYCPRHWNSHVDSPKLMNTKW